VADRGVHRLRVERVRDRSLRPERSERLGPLGRAGHARDLVSGGEQQRHEAPPDHACGAGEEDPHAAAGAAAERASSTVSGTAHTMPSRKPAEPMPSARLKRPRMFSNATMLVSSTIWTSSKRARNSSNSSSETETGVLLMPTA